MFEPISIETSSVPEPVSTPTPPVVVQKMEESTIFKQSPGRWLKPTLMVVIPLVLVAGAFYGGLKYQQKKDDATLKSAVNKANKDTLAYISRRVDTVTHATVSSVNSSGIALTYANGQKASLNFGSKVLLQRATAESSSGIKAGDKITLIQDKDSATGVLKQILVYLSQ